ncbi:vacuolar protein sorting-associated protein 18 homolog [Anopheles nili]|uniref:vacuolar protein sorting-associated protein 18 homolog n=1 Tax=Anopheles nili TaxID=185578 RepID=UPI00237B446C|nr:vacuolar protein sorting-associated protein 18 homolog [Anopheles nili]
MASMFDQYSSALIRENSVDASASTGPKTSGYVSVRTRKEVPIFTKQKMNLNLPSGILFMSVQNDWLMMLMTNLTVLRMHLKQPDKFTEVPIDKTIGGLRPSNIYVDPLGAHMFLTFLPKSPGFTPELLYLQRGSFKPKFVTKLKDQEITAIGFNHSNTSETSTGPILLGTAHGVIWEAEVGLESGDKLVQSNVRHAFDIGKGEPRPITGLEFYLKTEQKSLHCIVLVLTVDRLYKFHNTVRPSGGATTTAAQELKLGGYLQKVFSPYQNVDEQLRDFEELSASGSKGTNAPGNWPKLVFNYEEDFPKSFGCLTEHGINYQEIDPAINQPQFVVQKELITYPEPRSVPAPASSHKVAPKSHRPLSFILTDFHALLLYPDHVTAISLLDYQVVYEEYFVEQYGRLINIVKDVRSNVTFVYSNKLIFRYKIVNEQRNAWRLYADRQKFDLALQYCNKNPAHRDIVLVKQAQSYFYAGDLLQAAAIFSETQLSFEEVCLKFLQRNGNQALLLYLRNRLAQLKAHEMTQITMLIVWIVQVFLVELSHQRAGGGPGNDQATRDLQKQFESFMASRPVMACVRKNRAAIYDLMASYGDTHNLTALTTINQDYESVVTQYINQGRYEDVLAVLSAQNRPELVYQYAPIAMEVLPAATVAMLIGQGHRLDPVRLMPTLLCLDTPVHAHETVRYLEYCIHSRGCVEPAIHNYLIQLYGVHFPDRLLTFLESQGRDTTMVQYDLHYALRISLRHRIQPASVFLYCLLEMWVPAVRLALTFADVAAGRQLARQTATQPMDRTLRKRLWLIIAEHEIRGTSDEEVQRALGILQECDQLRIEDLLPYFSDFQRIDHFKEAICRSLKEYNVKIQEQRRDMEESAKSASRVRQELQTFRSRSVTIGAQEQCTVCGVYLMLRPFFVFHCGHKFHGDCLERQLMPYLSPVVADRLAMLKQSLASAQTAPLEGERGPNEGLASGVDASVPTVSHKEKLKSEIEAIISSECLYCGELMIGSLDKPFVENWQQADSEWD